MQTITPGVTGHVWSVKRRTLFGEDFSKTKLRVMVTIQVFPSAMRQNSGVVPTFSHANDFQDTNA